MSLFFLFNNVHFALEMVGAVAVFMAAWLTADTYAVKREARTLMRAVGFGCAALWQILYAISLGNDVLSYAGFTLYLIGLLLILGSYLQKQKLQVQAVVVLPAFALWSASLYGASALLLALIAFFSWRRSVEEHNVAQVPLSLGFILLSASALLQVFHTGSQIDIIVIAGQIVELIGFVMIARWVWQYLQLRIQESLIVILVSAALFLSTLVTLAFSMILLSQVTSETERNLLTDVRVLDLSIRQLKDEALAKTIVISKDDELSQALVGGDFAALERLTETLMQEYSLGFVTLADKDGSVLIRAHALSRRGDSLIGERAFEEASEGQRFATIEDSAVENFSIRAGAPIVVDGTVVGEVIAGYPLDNALVDNIKRVTGLEMFVYKGMIPVAATALSEDGRTRLTGIELSDGRIRSSVLEEGKTVTARTELYGEPFQASYLALSNGDGKIVGMISAAKPEQDILDIANSTNRLTLMTVLFIMLLLAYPIYALTRRLTEQ